MCSELQEIVTAIPRWECRHKASFIPSIVNLTNLVFRIGATIANTIVTGRKQHRYTTSTCESIIFNYLPENEALAH